MSKKVSFHNYVIVKTISTICPNYTNCHNKNCEYEHPQDTIYHETIFSKEEKTVKLLKSTKQQCPEK